MNCDITLLALLNGVMEHNVIRPSRIGPIRTAIKQYAEILGYNGPAQCPSAVFAKTDKVRNRLIEERAPQKLGSDALRNLKNNISYILRTGIELGIISAFSSELASWNDSNGVALLPKRNEYVCPDKYILDPVPQSLEEAISEYDRWSTRTSNRARPKSLRKRPISFSSHREIILLESGYLVKFRGFGREDIALLTLIEPTNVVNYLEWCIELQGRYTQGAAVRLRRIIAIAKYLQIIAKSSEQTVMIELRIRELRSFSASLGIPVKVQDKEKRWLTLSELEMVGLAIYPQTVRRIKRAATESAFTSPTGGSHKTIRSDGFRVLQSLLVRLLVRIPLRQRNLREMLWAPIAMEQGQNLFKKNGVWRLRFRGNELKISEVKGEVHSLAYDFPSDLVPLLEEWLYKWRPILIARQKETDQGKERQTDGQQFVFINSCGRPLTRRQITLLAERATFKFTGVSVNPHTIRNIFATEFIKGTNNFIDAAYMLGDSVQTVIDTYAKLLDEDCAKRASKWISHTLQGKISITNGEGDQSSLPVLVYPRSR
jgi:hypothetical protein